MNLLLRKKNEVTVMEEEMKKFIEGFAYKPMRLKMNKDIKIGFILGLNVAVETMFKKIWNTIHVESMCKHELFPALSEDMETITELIAKQKLAIEEIGELLSCKARRDDDCESDISAL